MAKSKLRTKKSSITSLGKIKNLKLMRFGALLVIALVVSVGYTMLSTSEAERVAKIPIGTIAVASSTGTIHYGDTVSFMTSVTGAVESNSLVFVAVQCSQNEKWVYRRMSEPSSGFELTTLSGDGFATWDTSIDAQCIGRHYYRYKISTTTYIILSSVPFTVAP